MDIINDCLSYKFDFNIAQAERRIIQQKTLHGIMFIMFIMFMLIVNVF